MNGNGLNAIAEGFLPEVIQNVDWSDMWDRPIQEGSAFQWTVFAAIASLMKDAAWELSLPVLDLPSGNQLYPLRNELPRHHGARPGHAARDLHGLRARFVQALVPKALLRKADESISIFVEGCPYHLLMHGADYVDRPDIVIVRGKPGVGLPKTIHRETQVEFSFEFHPGLNIAGAVRVMNSPFPRVVYRTPKGPVKIPVDGVVECSVNKSAAVASKQLQRYAELFSSPNRATELFLVSGNKLNLPRWPRATVDLSLSEGDVFDSFQGAARGILDSMSLT